MERSRLTALLSTWILLAGNTASLAAGNTASLAAVGNARETIPFLAGRLCPIEKHLFADAADGRLDRFSMLQAALVANGVDQPEVLQRYTQQLDRLVDELKRSGKLGGTPRHRTQVVFEFMHRRVLRGGYSIDCTDLPAAMDHGRFNCVSASVLFCCLAGRVGLEVCGLQMPGHAMCRVSLPDGPLDVETTCPGWFRLTGNSKTGNSKKQVELVEKAIGHGLERGRLEKDRPEAREISPRLMTAMIYYNRGFDLLAEKRFEEAAVANAKALRLDPASVTARGNLRATINNWALARESTGDYAGAAELLLVGAAFDPQYETFALNYVYVNHQWTEHLCGLGQFEEAIALSDRGLEVQPPLPVQYAELLRYNRRVTAMRWAEAAGELHVLHGKEERGQCDLTTPIP